MNRWIVVVIAGFVLAGCAGSRPIPEPAADSKARDSYSLGYEFGDSLRRQEVPVDPEILLSAVREGLDGAAPKLGPEEMRDAVRQLKKEVARRQDRRARELAMKNLEDGKKFLAAGRAREGVTTLAGGLQYEVLREGDGAIPESTDLVTVNYRGTLIDGTEFDSSYARGGPVKVLAGGVIKGWTEALTRMKTGSKWRISVPPDLGYGKRAFGRIPPNSTLVFELELVSVEGKIGAAPPDPSMEEASAGE